MFNGVRGYVDSVVLQTLLIVGTTGFAALGGLSLQHVAKRGYSLKNTLHHCREIHFGRSIVCTKSTTIAESMSTSSSLHIQATQWQ